jgi:hypothetical protein
MRMSVSTASGRSSRVRASVLAVLRPTDELDEVQAAADDADPAPPAVLERAGTASASTRKADARARRLGQPRARRRRRSTPGLAPAAGQA